jgi:hypothetical protein
MPPSTSKKLDRCRGEGSANQGAEKSFNTFHNVFSELDSLVSPSLGGGPRTFYRAVSPSSKALVKVEVL